MSHHDLTVNGTTIHVEDTGEPDLPVVLCLHSLFLDGRMFEGFAAAAAGRYRVVRPDFRGQGRSGPATTDLIDMDTCAADTASVMDELGLDEVHLLAQSMGGDVGFRLVHAHQARFRSMAALGSSARAEPPGQLEEFRAWVDGVGRTGFVGQTLQMTMEIMFGTTALADPDRAETIDLWRARIAAVPATLRPAMSGVIERSSALDLLPEITIPVLVVSGEEDLPRPPAWSDEMVDALPDVTLERLPRTGHSVILEAPRRVTSRVLDFFAEHGGVRA